MKKSVWIKILGGHSSGIPELSEVPQPVAVHDTSQVFQALTEGLAGGTEGCAHGMSESEVRGKKSRDKALSRTKQFLILGVVIVFLPVILLIAVVIGVAWLLWGAWLGLQVRWQWYPQGKRLLFVYSNSPIGRITSNPTFCRNSRNAL